MADEQEATETTETETETQEAPKIDPAELDDLKSQLEKLKAKNEELLGEKKKTQQQAQTAAEEAAKKSGDIEALEKSWREKLESREKELREEMTEREKWVSDLTVGQTATSIAADIAVQGSAKALLPHIKSRLGTDIRDGKPVTVVLDEDGKQSASTLDELKDEFMKDPAFAPLIVGSKASGAGGSSGKSASGGKSIRAEELEKMTPKDKSAYFQANPNVEIID